MIHPRIAQSAERFQIKCRSAKIKRNNKDHNSELARIACIKSCGMFKNQLKHSKQLIKYKSLLSLQRGPILYPLFFNVSNVSDDLTMLQSLHIIIQYIDKIP